MPQILTRRYTAVDTDGQAVSFPHVVRSCTVHVEGSTAVAHVSGVVSFLGSADAILTSDGTTLSIQPLSGSWNANETIYTIKAPAGTINVSVIAER